MKIAIKHSTKGFLLYNKDYPVELWTVDHSNRWIRIFSNVEQAEQCAKTLRNLDGELLKKVDIIEMLPTSEPFHFESYNVVKTIINEVEE